MFPALFSALKKDFGQLLSFPRGPGTIMSHPFSLIAVPVEPDALNAIMRLCLRLTRNWELAAMFADLGGIRLLLALTQVTESK